MTDTKGDVTEVPGGKKSPVLLIVLIVGVLVLVGAGAAGYFLLVAPKGQENAAAPAPVQASAQVPAASGQTAGAMGPIKEMDAFIVNLTDAQGTRYLKVAVQLEMSNLLLADEIDQKTPQIRDEVILLLSSKSFDDVATVAGKRALKRGMINGINKYLATGQILRVYFTEFVVQ